MVEENNTPTRFHLKRKEIPIELENETGVVQTYTMRELDGKQRDQWLNVMGSKMKIGPDGKPSAIKDFSGSQADLLSLSLYDSQNKLVLARDIQTWPASVQTELFKMAIKISSLDAKSEEDAGNV